MCAPINYPSAPDLVPNGAGAFRPPGTYGAAGDYYLYQRYRPTYQPFNATAVCYTPRTLDFYSGWPRYAQYFGIAANTITGCNGPQTPEQALWARPYWGPTEKRQNVVSGPAWGDLKIGAANITQLINLARGCFWNEATVGGGALTECSAQRASCVPLPSAASAQAQTQERAPHEARARD